MCRLAVRSMACVSVSDAEITAPPPCYTCGTVRHFQARYPVRSCTFSWVRYAPLPPPLAFCDGLFAAAIICVALRKGDCAPRVTACRDICLQRRCDVRFLKIDTVPASSTQVRRSPPAGKDVSALIDSEVHSISQSTVSISQKRPSPI